MSKAARQSLLLRIVRERTPRTQEEVAELLAARGVEVSQVTLSRDLRELGVVKAPQGYREPGAAPRPPEETLLRALREFVLAVDVAQNLVVLKTNPGGAAAVALALDRSGWGEIVGTVAGDDTIFAATASPTALRRGWQDGCTKQWGPLGRAVPAGLQSGKSQIRNLSRLEQSLVREGKVCHAAWAAWQEWSPAPAGADRT